MGTLKRVTFYVPALDPDSGYYETANSDEIDPEQMRHVDSTERANAVSSWTDDEDLGDDNGLHLPCIDVDVSLNVGQRLVRDLMFPDVRVVGSSTAGHTHWYSETPITWADYKEKLRTLVDCDIVEEGYALASIARGATFLRLSHVKKREA